MPEKKTAESLREAGLEPLTYYGAARGKYERWLASEGVPVMTLYAGPKGEAVPFGLYDPNKEQSWAPVWVNELGSRLRGQRLVDAVRQGVRTFQTEEYTLAVSAAFDMGGLPAVEALVLREVA